MTTTRWLGRAKAVAQITTATPGGTIGTETFTLTINGKSVTYTAVGGDTVALVVDGLLAAWNVADDTFGEFDEAAASDSTTHLTLTGDTSGYPFTVTGSATGLATLVISTTTAATGPNHWDNVNNWSAAAVPVSTDDVIVGIPVSILHGLNQSAVTLNSLVIESSFSNASIGLPRTNANGYTEYRPDYLSISATTVKIGVGEGNGSGRIKIDFGSVQSTIEVRKTGQPTEANIQSILLKGTHASNAADVQSGFVGFASFGGESCTLLTLRTATGADVYCGEGCTLGTVSGEGVVRLNSAVTTMTQFNGRWEISGASAVTTFTQHAGTLLHKSSGTFGTSTIGGILDCSRDASPRTMTTVTLDPGGRILDPMDTITFTNNIAPGTGVREITAS